MSIINGIKELPLNTETTIAKLINYNLEEKMIDLLTQGNVLGIVCVVCDEINLKLEVLEDSIGGLAYNYRFKKIFDENLPYPNCKYCGAPTVLETMEDGTGEHKSPVCSKCGKHQNVGAVSEKEHNKYQQLAYSNCSSPLMFCMPDGKVLCCNKCNKYFINDNGTVGDETSTPYTRNEVLY